MRGNVLHWPTVALHGGAIGVFLSTLGLVAFDVGRAHCLLSSPSSQEGGVGRGFCTSAAVVACGAALACGASDPYAAFDARIAAVAAEIVDVRRDIHRHPELSGAETRTAGLVAERLRTLGYDVRTGVGGHGVVGTFTGRPGPTVAFRADMDAVRSDALDPVPFDSEVPGVRHICGHDVHTAVGLALAEGFAAIGDDLPGAVMLLFQPAEENATGARSMIEAGVFRERRPDAIFAVHAAPLEVGQLATAETALLPARDLVTVTADGRRALAVVQQARRILEGAGTISAGQAFTPVRGEFVYPDVGQPQTAGGTAWSLRAVMTVSSEATRAALRDRVVPALAALDTAATAVRVDYRPGMVDGVTNDPAVVALAAASVRRALGDDGLVMLDEMVPAFSEDFGAFQALVPGVMFFLGVSNTPAGTSGMPHSPDFVADEGAIAVGARAMGAAMLDRLLAAGPR